VTRLDARHGAIRASIQSEPLPKASSSMVPTSGSQIFSAPR
jgi:hypothetical protein